MCRIMLLGLLLCFVAVSGSDYDTNEYDGEIPIPEFVSTSQIVEGKIGSQVSLPCDVNKFGYRRLTRLWHRRSLDGSVESIITRGGNPDKRLSLTDSGTLKIEGLTQADAGVYSCRLSTSKRRVLYHTVRVLAPPSVKPTKSMIVVSKGQPVTLQCEATGTPLPVITWKHFDDQRGPSRVRPPSDVQNIRTTTTTTTTRPKSSSSLPATTTTKSPAKELEHYEYDYEYYDDYEPAPKLQPAFRRAGRQVRTEEPVVLSPLNKETEANPGATKLRNRRQTLKVASKEADVAPTEEADQEKILFDGKMSITGESITISSVAREHSGSYECVATNSEGIDKTKVTLDVQYPPEIEVEKTSMNSREGYDADLTCTVHAEPKAQVTWQKNNEPISIDDGRIKVMKSGSTHVLSVKNVKTSDFGNYSCLAVNNIGKAKAVIEVTAAKSTASSFVTPLSSLLLLVTVSSLFK